MLTLLNACGPSTEHVSATVAAQLQERINNEIPEKPGTVSVSKVVVVQESGHKYKGLATVLAYGTPLTLSLQISADRKNVIYDLSSADWAEFLKAAHQSKFKSIDGKYSDVAVRDELIFTSFPATLAQDKAKFAERLQVVSPVQRDDNMVFGSGCEPHLCTFEAAAWIINTTTGRGSAIIETTSIPTGSEPMKHFAVYGENIEHLPPRLLEWAVDSGMTSLNSVLVQPVRN